MANVIEQARAIRAAMNVAGQVLDDETALEAKEIFPYWSETEHYVVGQRARYGENLYTCLLEHTAQSAWTPTEAFSLWAQVLIEDPNIIPEWIQPESTNPYKVGDKVTHNGKTWECVIDNNVWEPGVYGWVEAINQ